MPTPRADIHEPGDLRVLRRRRSTPVRIARGQAALAAAWTAHLATRRHATRTYLAPSTSDGMRRAIRVWVSYLDTEAGSDAPDAGTIAAFRRWAARTRSAASVVHLLQAVRACYRWAEATGRHPDIARTVALPQAPRAEALPELDAEQVRRAAAAIAGDDLRARRDRAILWLLWSCPVDSIALHRAAVGDLDLDRGVLRLATRWRISLARRHGREPFTDYPLHPRALIALAAYLEVRGDPAPDEPLLLGIRGRRRLSLLSLRLAVLRALSAAGMRRSGIARRQAQGRYPRVEAGDLADLAPRLPADPALADQLRALLHLVALPDAHIAWERLPCSAVAADAGSLQVRGRGRSGPSRRIALPAAAQAALASWLARHPRPLGRLFPGQHPAEATAHHLRQLAWSCFPERLPPGPKPGGRAGSTALLRQAALRRLATEAGKH